MAGREPYEPVVFDDSKQFSATVVIVCTSGALLLAGAAWLVAWVTK